MSKIKSCNNYNSNFMKDVTLLNAFDVKTNPRSYRFALSFSSSSINPSKILLSSLQNGQTNSYIRSFNIYSELFDKKISPTKHEDIKLRHCKSLNYFDLNLQKKEKKKSLLIRCMRTVG